MNRILKYTVLLFSLFLFTAVSSLRAEGEIEDITYISSADNTPQPAFAFVPAGEEPVPLLVVLHQWSSDYRHDDFPPLFFDGVKSRGWAMIVPNFRGPNSRPEACGSELAVQDIVSAVDYMKTRRVIDENRVYLVGNSGGGHMAMLMAGRHPEIWAGVSSWVGISDLAAWHDQCEAIGKNRYPGMLEAVCGGAPGDSPEVDQEYKNRSALTWIQNAAGIPVSLNAGIHDGHSGRVVPVSQTLNAFNLLAAPGGRLTEEQVQAITEGERIPAELVSETDDDPLFGEKKVLFRRSSGNVTVTIFDGGHESIPESAFDWLSRQRRGE